MTPWQALWYTGTMADAPRSPSVPEITPDSSAAVPQKPWEQLSLFTPEELWKGAVACLSALAGSDTVLPPVVNSILVEGGWRGLQSP